ncbi:DUF2721 domain-containing protein [Sphingomonas morindae]|uniref:DUF2721 domain-containing protein n=1 Tax=Sphingomonas morindae TaxID=1541170 RepID=A0ABY4X4C0_9SPHN|nr:DUF2721 domain-containing protein [Sphingomonas morindae]USI71743.1 DUF2721 domain-containing protein [Sphingomonas morindae]
MTELPSQTIAHTIQLAVGPVFLLTGLGQILNLFAGRLARVIDRSRVVELRIPELGPGEERDRAVWELRLLDRRMRIVSAAITFGTVSALAIALVVAGLFISGLIGGGFGRATALLFVLATLSLMVALLLFLYEIHLANRSTRVRHELLEHEAGDPRSG